MGVALAMESLARAIPLVVAFLCIRSDANSDVAPVPTTSREVETIGGVGHIPRIYLIRKFATDAEMDHMINKSFHNMLPQEQNTETGMVYELPIGEDPILKNYYKRLYDLFPPGVGAPPASAADKTLRIRRYMAANYEGKNFTGHVGGDYHPPHVDWFETNPGDMSHVLLMTQMLYLSSPEEGGQTDFPRSLGGKGFKFEPVRGDLVIWWSCHSNGTRDHDSEHASLPLKRGIKWNAAFFVYDDTKQCKLEPVKRAEVPAAVLKNVPQTDSTKSLFGFSYPSTVSVSAKGTRTSKSLNTYTGYDGVEVDPNNPQYRDGSPPEDDEIVPEGETAAPAPEKESAKSREESWKAMNDARGTDPFEGFDKAWLDENPKIKAQIAKGDFSWADSLEADTAAADAAVPGAAKPASDEL